MSETQNAAQNDDLQDISLAHYLSQDDNSITDFVRTRHGRVKIAALMEDEVENIRRACEKPDVKRGRGATRFDDQQFKVMVAARSLHKANPDVTEAELLAQLRHRLSGDVATFAAAAVKLSGFDDRAGELDQAVGFTG